eukprot:6547328-Prymnesium_polylepis.1
MRLAVERSNFCETHRNGLSTANVTTDARRQKCHASAHGARGSPAMLSTGVGASALPARRAPPRSRRSGR